MQLLRNLTLLFVLILPTLSIAEETTAKLEVELNAIDIVGEACRLTFVVNNNLESDIDKLVAETVLFSDQNQVVLLTLFDFGKLPSSRPRVRQFQIPDASCDRLGQVLINGVDSCVVGGAEVDICEKSLSLKSRVRIGMSG